MRKRLVDGMHALRRRASSIVVAAWAAVGTGAFAGGIEDDRRAMVDTIRRYAASASTPISERTIEAMASVAREEFVPASDRDRAYRDYPLPIGYGQTISQPYIVAVMTELADVGPGEKVLEIGTGSGYQAAVLSKLAGEVYTIEIVKPLADESKKRLARLGYANVEVRAGDGYAGWPEHAPFDAIVVTAAPDAVPEPLVEQLREGGKLVIPVGASVATQELTVLEKNADGTLARRQVLPVRFVPLTRDR